MFINRKSGSAESTSVTPSAPESLEVPSVVFAMADKIRGNNLSREQTEPGTSAEPTVLGAGTCFKGVMTSPGPVHAKGQLEGDFSAPHFTLSSTGQMTGKLNCKKLVIDGSLDGELECDEAVAGAESVLSGTINCRSLQAAPGASISGKIEIGKLHNAASRNSD